MPEDRLSETVTRNVRRMFLIGVALIAFAPFGMWCIANLYPRARSLSLVAAVVVGLATFASGVLTIMRGLDLHRRRS